MQICVEGLEKKFFLRSRRLLENMVDKKGNH